MWKNKNVWILLTGEFIAGVGLWLGIIGNLEFMQERVPSDFLKSLILASGLLAGIAVGPFAGRITDQLNKNCNARSRFCQGHQCYFYADCYSNGICVVDGSVPGYDSIVSGLLLSCTAGSHPSCSCRERFVAAEWCAHECVHPFEDIGYSIGWCSVSHSAIIHALYRVAGRLPGSVRINLVYGLRGKREQAGPGKESAKNSGGFKEVFPIIKGLPIVFMTLILTLVPLLFLGGFNLMVINISELQDSSSIKGLIYTAEGIGFMLGAFIVKQISQKRSPYAILFFFSFVIGVSQLLLYFADVPVLSIAAFFVFGFAVGCFFPTAATIFQTRVPKEFHGRFFSFRNMLDRVIFQIVLLLTGFLLDAVGLQIMVVIFGILSLVMTAAFFVKFKQIRTEVQIKEEIST